MARDSAAAAAIPFGRREVLGPHPLDEIVVGGGLDDLVELRAVVGDQAHTFDDDVADAPAVLLARQPSTGTSLPCLVTMRVFTVAWSPSTVSPTYVISSPGRGRP